MECVDLVITMLTLVSVCKSARPCGGIFSTDRGTFHSPNYPASYNNHAFCKWTINGGAGSFIRLEFNSTFVLESHSGCTFDSVKVFDVLPDGIRILKGAWCSHAPPTLTSSSHGIDVEFKSDSSNTYTGFSASWRKIEIMQYVLCDFENSRHELCGYSQPRSTIAYWRWRKGRILSYGLAPQKDHTLNSHNTGHYASLDLRGVNGGTGQLVIDQFLVHDHLCMSFWYYINDAGVRSFYVYLAQSSSTNPVDDDKRRWYWRGSKSRKWLQAFVDISDNVPFYKIIFQGVVKGSYKGGLAIDDIRFLKTHCPPQDRDLKEVSTDAVLIICASVIVLTLSFKVVCIKKNCDCRSRAQVQVLPPRQETCRNQTATDLRTDYRRPSDRRNDHQHPNDQRTSHQRHNDSVSPPPSYEEVINNFGRGWM